MPIMRNPFRKQDENLRPATSGVDKSVNGTATQPISIKKEEPAEYKLSGMSNSAKRRCIAGTLVNNDV